MTSESGGGLVAGLALVAARVRQAADRRGGSAPAALTAAVEVLVTDYGREAPARIGRSGVIGGIADVFDLDEIEAELLIVAAAPDLDASFALAFAALQGQTEPARASVGLAHELCGVATLSAGGMARLGPSSRLVRTGLVQVGGTAPWLTRTLSVPDRVLAHLLGVAEPEPAVRALVVDPIPLDVAGSAAVARAIDAGVPLVWVRAPLGTAGSSLAAQAFAAAGIGCLCLDLERLPVVTRLQELLGSAVRESALRGLGLILLGADRLAAPEAGGAFGVFADAVVPVVLVGTRPWHRAWLPGYPLTVDAPALRPQDRATAWVLAGGDDRPGDGLAGLSLSAEMISDAARYALLLARSVDEPVTAELVRLAARQVGGATVVSGAQRRGQRGPGFADLVLPTHIMDSLHRLVSWGRGREKLRERDTVHSPTAAATGIAAMFSGGPGTGKTLAAQVVADELGLDLLRVDLSSIVDKYIGETEKNLERVFHEAESLNVVLFFDEADSLFGKRSDVKDAHDRYANQEVAYLLQRIEKFDGITVLATNLRGNLDPAFSRRLSFIIHFPDPDEPTRQRLWELHLQALGPQDTDDPIDTARLAATVEMAGGDIRNIVRAVAYDCAASDEPPGMRHVFAATVAEYQKLGRRVPPAMLA